MFKKLLEWIYILFLFFLTSYLFYPSILFRAWMIPGFSYIIVLKTALTGLMAVLVSTFLLSPIVLRAVKSLDEPNIDRVLQKMVKQLKMKKKPKIYQIRTAQLNAISYLMLNQSYIGLSTGMVEAYQDHRLDEKDLEGVFAHLLPYHMDQNIFKRNFVYGIASFYYAIGMIVISLSRGFLRLAKLTEQKLSRVLAWILGYFCIFVGNVLSIPQKLVSILASGLIFQFQQQADQIAVKLTSPEAMRDTLQKIIQYNQNIDKKVSLLAYPEYWFTQPIQLLKMDRFFLFRPPLEKRVKSLFSP